jgi:hypothetical protein
MFVGKESGLLFRCRSIIGGGCSSNMGSNCNGY